MENQINIELPAVEFVLILPKPRIDNWLEVKVEEDELIWVESVQLTRFDAKLRFKLEMFGTSFICQDCHIVTKNQCALTQHMKVCARMHPTKFECDNCGEKFKEKLLMQRHILKHSNERKFCCLKCGSRFKTKYELIKHSQIKRMYKCLVCETKFSCKLLFNHHRRKCHVGLMQCNQCLYKTSVETYLVRHKKIHDKSFACEICQRKFSYNQALKSHQIQFNHGIFAETFEGKFECEKCEKSFSNSLYLKRHQIKVHDKTKVKCEVCSKICKNQIALYHHSLSHIEIKCLICHKIFSKRSIWYHRQIHFNKKIFQCDRCVYSNKAKRNLKKHIESKHLSRKHVKNL